MAHQTGFIEWRVTDDLLQQFKDSQHQHVFYSPEFKSVDGTSWRINFYPRGYESPDYCSILLDCVTLSKNKPQIGVNYLFNIPQLEWEVYGGSTFKQNVDISWGLTKIFKSDTINNLQEITIKCLVEETLHFGDEHKNIEWKVNKPWMQMCKNAKHKQSFSSPRFNAFGAEWKLRIYPNGWSTKGSTELDIACQSMHQCEEKEINICYYIEIKALNYLQVNLDGTIIKEKDDYIECNPSFNFADIQKHDEITISLKIWRRGSMHLNESRLLSDIYSHKMKLQKELKQEQSAVSNLNHEIISVKRENKTIREKLKEFAMKDLKREELIRKIQRENKEMVSQLDICGIKEIKTFDSPKEILIRHDIMKKQHEFDIMLQLNENRLNEWLLDSVQIETELKCKEAQNGNVSTDDLLYRYMKCKTLCDKQQNRMQNVVMHCKKLNNIKKILKKENIKCNTTVTKMETEYNELNKKYEGLQKEQMELENKWKHALIAMNTTIDSENETNALKYSVFNEFNIYNLESQHWNTLYSKCMKLIQKYRSFDTQNETTIERMKVMFDKLWIKSMKQWFEWEPNDIISWIKYLQIENQLTLSKEFNFDQVLDEMNKLKMNGTSFKNIDKADLETIGVMTLNDRQQIYHKINELMAMYPHIENNEDHTESMEGDIGTENEMNNINIPKEFICPLTKKIMREPVTIFDNNTYEKDAIEKYLEEYNKSPITDEECDDDEDWTLIDRKLKEKIEIFLSVNYKETNHVQYI